MPFAQSHSSSLHPGGELRPTIPPPLYAQRSAIHLAGEVLPLSQTTLVSKRLTVPYRLINMYLTFPPGCDNLVRAHPILSYDPSVSTSGTPPGTSLLSPGSPTDYIVGDDLLINVPMGRIVLERGTYLKLHLDNNDGFSHTLVALITIEEFFAED